MVNERRIIYLDVARICAMFSVVILHVAAEGWYGFDIHSKEWAVYNAYYGFTRWGVPVFLMISGALFLGREKEITINSIFGKYIKRLVIAYVFWAIVYACKDVFIVGEVSFGSFLKTVVEGHYHMWYIPLIIGIYLLLPVLKELTKNDVVMYYLLLLLLFFYFVVPTIGLIPQLSGLYRIFDRILFSAFGGYGAYFLLGYFLNKVELKKTIRYLIYLLGLLGAVATALTTMIVSRQNGALYIDVNSGFMVNVLFTSVAIFVFAKYMCTDGRIHGSTCTVLAGLSESMFGVYLVHVLVLELLEQIGISALKYESLWTVLIISFAVWLISLFVVLGIRQIPLLKKYIV